MKFHLVYILAIICVFQSAVFAQQTTFEQKTETNSPCSKFRTPLIKPNFDTDNTATVIKPDTKNYKIIIISPCVSNDTQQSNFFVIDTPEPVIVTETRSAVYSQTFKSQPFGIRRNNVTWTYFTKEDSTPKRPVLLFNVPK